MFGDDGDRIGNVLKLWISEYFSDFESNPDLSRKVEEFVDSSLSIDMEALARAIKKHFTYNVGLSGPAHYVAYLELENVPSLLFSLSPLQSPIYGR